MSEPVIAMALAMDRNKLIGKAGGMPWHVPGEQAYFKSITLGKPIVMGRKTFESIGRPLPGRTNIVVTRNADWQAEGVLVGASFEQALVLAQQTSPAEIVVIGGAGLCREAMPVTQRIYLSLIDHEFEGDTWFDSFHWEHWREISRRDSDPANSGGYRVAYLLLERRQVQNQVYKPV